MNFVSPPRCETFTQPPIQWEPGTLSLGVKRPFLEADPSPPSSAPNTASWRGAQLNHWNNFTFTL